jgi:glutaredoxin-like protein
MEKLLNEQVISQISQTFEQMKEPVQILFFGSQDNCEYCTDTRQLLEEVAAINEKLGLSIYDLSENADMANKFNIDKVPAMVIAAKDGDEITNFGVQYSGIPAGHEFGTLINDIVLVSSRDSGLGAETREFLKNLNEPLHLQVFVTPTCPHCPRAVLLANGKPEDDPSRRY